MQKWVVKLAITDCPQLRHPLSVNPCTMVCARHRHMPCSTQDVIFEEIEAVTHAEAIDAAINLAMMDRPWVERKKDVRKVHAFHNTHTREVSDG